MNLLYPSHQIHHKQLSYEETVRNHPLRTVFFYLKITLTNRRKHKKAISDTIRNGFNSFTVIGDLGGIRTPDPRLRRPLLYPTELPDQKLERAMGIEPTTSAWKAEVLPLNYTRNLLSNALCIWSERQDSNLRPPAPKAGALPS